MVKSVLNSQKSGFLSGIRFLYSPGGGDFGQSGVALERDDLDSIRVRTFFIWQTWPSIALVPSYHTIAFSPE